MKDFAKLAAPLHKLLKKPEGTVQNNKIKKEVFDFNADCEKAFDLLKERLVSYPILRQPDPEKQFLLFTDASGFALGAILSQVDENNNEYVCAYASRKLKGAEVHYGITEKEALGVVWGIKYFRIYMQACLK